MLLPGFTNAYHMHTLDRCQTTIAAYRAEAREFASELAAEVAACAINISPDDGLVMARLRGTCWMPYWSRLAIAHFRKAGYSQASIARSFQCSERTVHTVINRSQFLNPDRIKTRFQQSPPARNTAA